MPRHYNQINLLKMKDRKTQFFMELEKYNTLYPVEEQRFKNQGFLIRNYGRQKRVEKHFEMLKEKLNKVLKERCWNSISSRNI